MAEPKAAAETCKLCSGSGKKHGYMSAPCNCCHGRGRRPSDPGRTDTCLLCSGLGKKDGFGSEPCEFCDGYGRRQPRDVVAEPEGPLVWYVEAGKPRTAHLTLASVFATLSGHVRVCDPYYGHSSLLRLDLILHCKPVWLLTQNADSKDRLTLPQAIREYRRQHGVEFRLHSGTDLHDRFVLTDDAFVLMGHGLKDIGNKESFIVKLDRSIAGGIIDTIREAFDRRWPTAQNID